MRALAYADPGLDMLSNMFRFAIMLLGGVLLGLLYRWARRERRRQYMGVGIGLSLLTLESIIDHYQRLGEAISYRAPLDLVAFGVLVASLIAITRSTPPRTADRRHR